MKITKREKVMLRVLFALILFSVYYISLLNPRLKQITRLREEKNLLTGEISKTENNRNEDKLIKVNVEELSKEMKLLSVNHFNHIEEEDVINIIDEFINNSGLKVNSMTILSDNLDFHEVNGMSIPRISVTLSYTDYLDELMKFIWEIENYHKKIIIRNLSIAGGEVINLTGSVTLELYYFPILDDKKNVAFYPGSKRENPFIKVNSKKME